MTGKPSRHDITHARILEVAARALRQHGAAGVRVAEVMQQAGLTHGGFYAHFESREALLAEAIESAGLDGAQALGRRVERARARGASALRAVVEAYLSEDHLVRTDGGCVVAALGSEMARLPPALLATAAARVDGLIRTVQAALPAGGTKAQATLIASTMVGALQLARALGVNAQGKSLLATTRRALLAQHETH